MRSKPALVPGRQSRLGSPLVKSCWMTRNSQSPVYLDRQSPIFLLIRSRARRSLSMKTTNEAFLLNASSPMAPVPAKRSRTFAPRTESPRMLNMAPRALSEVGRILLSRGGGVKSFRPFAMPLIILKSSQNRQVA